MYRHHGRLFHTKKEREKTSKSMKGKNKGSKNGMWIDGRSLKKMRNVPIAKVKCLRCGFEWYPRFPPPRQRRQCPKCYSYFWNKEEETKEKETKGAKNDRRRCSRRNF